MYELESTIRARLTGRHSTFQFGGHRGRLVMMFDLLVAYIVGVAAVQKETALYK